MVSRIPSPWGTVHCCPASSWRFYGLRPGDAQRLVLHPEQAFGVRDPAKIHHLPRAVFADDLSLDPGIIIGFTGTGGEEIPGTVLSVTDAAVEVDFNHPLAGHAVTFDVEIIDVIPADSNDDE
jgi:FKBP-type peptidyl-prolyl cis-trans isomerase SlpA